MELTAERRAASGGQYVTLSEGVTHYELAGATGETTVVLVHGFSVPSFIWDPTFEALKQAGFRVLRYDLFGRGLSDRPRGRYDLERFVRQLAELLRALQLSSVCRWSGFRWAAPSSPRLRRVSLNRCSGWC
jgi:pimeloyl-ACP methyl ester carboxylesterase